MTRFLALSLASLLLAACAVPAAPRYDAQFGNAVREARLRQTLNPDAGASAGALTGMDGAAAREAQVRYRDSYKAPPPVVNVINIGGHQGSASQ